MEHKRSNRAKQIRYRTFLLTCWQESDDRTGISEWRYKLEATHGGRRWVFAQLKETMAWIENELDDETWIGLEQNETKNRK